MNLDNMINVFEIAVEEIFNPSSKDMRLLKDKIYSLINNGNIVPKENNDQIKNITIDKKTKKPHSIVPDNSRCEALIYDLEYDSTNKLVPARCKRSMLYNSTFCKQHGSKDGTVNQEDSQHFNKPIIHEYKWGHLGTINSPSYVFEKSYDILLKKYNNKNKINDFVKKNNIVTSEIKKNNEIKTKRSIANAFITYKSDNFENIKKSIISENPNITGRDLVIAITKEASERWKYLNNEEKLMYKNKALFNKNIVSKPVTLLITDDDIEEEVTIPNIHLDEEEENTLVFNSNLNVWVDTDNNLCYESKNNTLAPCGQLRRGKMTVFPKK
jgi:hypothetical protein